MGARASRRTQSPAAVAALKAKPEDPQSCHAGPSPLAEGQAATREILGLVAQVQADAQPVFDGIAEAALRLCQATSSNVVTFDGELIHVAAVAPNGAGGADAVRAHFATYPRRPNRDTANTR